MKKSRNNIFAIYWLLCALRIVLVFIPQTGYIHPDEYFQTIELFASRKFDIEGHITWDFNVTNPIRSIGVPYFTIGASYTVLQALDYFFAGVFGIRLLTPYSLVVIPRLFVSLLSFICDWSLYQICKANNEKFKGKLLILASSYVMLVFGGRTFSNTIEMILVSILLYFVSESMIFSNVIVKHHEYLRKRYEKSKTPTDKAKFHKLRLFLAGHNTRNFISVSTVTVLGFFNRPTFPCFAIFPVFFWVYRGMGFRTVSNLQFHLRLLLLVVCAIPVILFLILVDSFFYGYISWGEIGMFDISMNSFVFPSLNFIKYNLNENNLRDHQMHPNYLHLFVNLPLLFNVLGVFTFIMLADITFTLARKKYHLLPTIRSIKGLMTTTLLTPLFLLSYVPHQEPRFIVPLLLPLVYLFANKIYEEPEQAIVEADEIKPEITAKKSKPKSNFLLKIWIVLNVSTGLFFGFVHQGGVYPACNYLSREIRQERHVKFHLFTSHVYMVPQVLFLQPKLDKLYETTVTKFQLTKRVFFYEDGSKSLNVTLGKISVISRIAREQKLASRSFLMMPSSLDHELKRKSSDFDVDVRLHKSFYPHLSTEAMPDFTRFLHNLAYVDVKNLNFDELYESFFDILYGFGLNIYEISAK